MEEQLQIIQDMLDKTRQKVADNGNMLIMWGWLILAACFGQYTLVYFQKGEWIGLLWFTLMTGGGIVSAVPGFRQEKRKGVVTYADQSISSVWIACGLGMFLIAFVGLPIGVIPMQALNPVLMTIIWIGVFVTSKVIEWKTLQWSALLWFAGSIICMFTHWHFHALIMALIIIPGYLVPGYILRKKFKSVVNG